MTVQRFLGAGWASVHGPSDPRRLLIRVLEGRFAGLAVAPGPRPLDWSMLRTLAADLPFEFAAVRVGNPLAEQSPTRTLLSTKDGERAAATKAIQHAVALARTVGCAKVVLDLGVVPMLGEIEAEDLGDPTYHWTPERAGAIRARAHAGRHGALDRACRELFAIVRSMPEIEFCLTQSRSARGLAEPGTLQDLFEDLHHLRLYYWHDAALAARRQQVFGEPQGEWLERFANRCRGMSLGDASPDGLYLPPGAGGVDYAGLASYVPRTGGALPVVVELDIGVPPAELPGVRSCLDKFGL
jgi:sugar phosphate isomerase/epimerase